MQCCLFAFFACQELRAKMQCCLFCIFCLSKITSKNAVSHFSPMTIYVHLCRMIVYVHLCKQTVYGQLSPLINKQLLRRTG
ncbi:hypothetical protein O6H91_Y443200 [Diphasiastrum complanatum]|nr:hypothetical protein O6H91_Y443200 [Diphasiastrum complanatum]